LNVLGTFLSEFQWPENITESVDNEARFRLTWIWKDLIEEDGFQFPK
jgi:hypothetical protein